MGELPQRQLALDLRYYIDLNAKDPGAYRRRIESIIRNNPHGVKSKHVEHNLGRARMDWLREEGLL